MTAVTLSGRVQFTGYAAGDAARYVIIPGFGQLIIILCTDISTGAQSYEYRLIKICISRAAVKHPAKPRNYWLSPVAEVLRRTQSTKIMVNCSTTVDNYTETG